MKMEDKTRSEIANAVNVLREGGIILYPTETVWGLGCDARNEEAVQAIFNLKQRPEAKSMIVLLEDEGKLQRYMQEVPEVAWDLIDCTDKPLTIIYPLAKNLAKNAVADDGSIAIRITKHEFCRQLLRRFNGPIISTSANLSGSPTPYRFGVIEQPILDGVDYVVDLERNQPSQLPPSTIIKLNVNGEFQIVRS